MRALKVLLITLLLLAAYTVSLAAPAQAGLGLNVQEFTLKNGMQFLVVERHATPQVAFRLAIRAGSALEDSGKTGIAHLLEHMMFKGTANFGTLDREKDRGLQARIEAAYQMILGEERKRVPDRKVIQAKREEMERLRLEVQRIYVPQVLSSQLGKNGAVGVNAFTTKDQTQYTASLPSDMVEQWFSIMSEQIFEPSWREFYVEKDVVQREWAFRYVNNPDGAAWLDFDATAYRAHPYRNPVIGWKSDMEKYSTTDAVEFHKKYYNPNNAVCVIVGDITLEKARGLAERYFERYTAGLRAPETVTQEPAQQGPRKSVRYLKGARKPVLLLGFHGAPMGTPDFYALDALSMVLSQGRGARITQEIVEKGLAVDAWAANPDGRYGGMVVLGGSPPEPGEVRQEGLSEEEQRQAYLKACEALEQLLLAQVERLRIEPVSRRDLDRVKKLNHREFLDRMRTNEALAGTLAGLEVEVGWRYIATYLEKIEALTPEDVMRVAGRYLKPEGRTTVVVIPGGEVEQAPESYTETRSLGTSAGSRLTGPGDLENHSAYLTPAGWRHPLSFDRSPKKIEYPQAAAGLVAGAKVFYLPDRELPLVDLTLLVRAGRVDVERAKTGLTKLLASSLVRGGTKEYSPAELARLLDENAVRLSVTGNEEESVIHLSVMKEDWEKGLDILEEVLTRPRFDPQVLEVVKAQTLAGLRRQAGEARAVGIREGMIWHFRGHPYGRDPLEGLKAIPGITSEELRTFLRRYFVPSNMVACVAGDVEKETVLNSLSRLFRALPQDPAPDRGLADPAATPPVLSLIHKPGQVQSQVFMLLPSVKRTHPDFWKMALLMHVFGGSESIMYTRLRDDLGLVYAAGFTQTYKWNAGLLVGYIGCKAEKTTEAVRETIRLMRGTHREIPEKELEEKRLDALNSFVFNVDTPLELVQTYGQYQMRGEPLDTLSRIQDAYLQAGRAELMALAGKYLQPERLQVFVVTDKGTRVKSTDGKDASIEEALTSLAKELSLPYQEIPLR
ncbi:MAG: pitrilysin family protein [Thermodesulfobacteriota bacterium]